MSAAKSRGFAAMNPDRQKAIASAGGKAAHAKGRAHEFTPDEGRAAGIKGGRKISENREHMARIGRLGGLTVSKDTAHMSAIGKLGGANLAKNTSHMSEIGKRGGAAVSADKSHMSAIGKLSHQNGKST